MSTLPAPRAIDSAIAPMPSPPGAPYKTGWQGTSVFSPIYLFFVLPFTLLFVSLLPLGNSSRALKAGQRRPRKMFTDAEVLNLVKGVERFGEGKWARILETYKFDDRTSVDLKDKWRNLQKPASTVKVPKGVLVVMFIDALFTG